MSDGPLIRMFTFDPRVVTPAEYEEMRRDVLARVTAGLREPGDRILAALLVEHEGRYRECLASQKEPHAP